MRLPKKIVGLTCMPSTRCWTPTPARSSKRNVFQAREKLFEIFLWYQIGDEKLPWKRLPALDVVFGCFWSRGAINARSVAEAVTEKSDKLTYVLQVSIFDTELLSPIQHRAGCTSGADTPFC